MKRLPPLVLAGLLAITALASDVVGAWTATAVGKNGPIKMEFTFKRTGAGLTGTAATPVGKLPVSQIKITGDKISFVVLNGKFKIIHEGTISGDEMKLKIHNPGETVDAIAKRSGP